MKAEQKNFLRQVGAILKQNRSRLRLSLSEVSEKTGVIQSELWLLEQGSPLALKSKAIGRLLFFYPLTMNEHLFFCLCQTKDRNKLYAELLVEWSGAYQDRPLASVSYLADYRSKKRNQFATLVQ